MIKLKIGDYEVTVSAKDISLGDTRNNTKATENFLNELSIFMGEGFDNCPTLEKCSHKFADDIYDALSARGLYDIVA